MTRDDTTLREKGRAVVLAALMVLSVVAMSAAFAGGAAAQSIDADLQDQSVDSDGQIVVEDVSDADGLWVIVEDDGDDTIVGAEQVEGDETQDVLVTVTDDANIEDPDGEFTEIENNEVTAGNDHVAHLVDEDDASDGSVDTDTLVSVSDETSVYSTNAAEITADSFEVSDLEPPTVSAPAGETFDASVTVNNTALTEDTQTVTLTAEGQLDGTYEEEVEDLGAGEETTVEFNNVQIDSEADPGSYDLTVTAEGDSEATGTLFIGTEDQEGSLSVDVRGDFEPEFDDPVNVTLYGNAVEDGGASIDNPDHRITTIQTDEDGVADFRNLAVFGDDDETGIEYAAVAAPDDADFESDVDRTTLWNDRTSTGMTVFIDRVIDADQIDVVDVRPDNQVGLDESIEVDTLTLTEDYDVETDGMEPFEEAEVHANVVESNVDDVDGVSGNNNLQFDGIVEADDEGISQFEFDLSPDNADDVNDVVTYTVEFHPEPRDNTDVVAEAELRFVPDIGDTGTISGDVDELTLDSDEERPSNIESAEDVPVHAVQLDSVLDNTLTIEDGYSLADAPETVQVDGESYEVRDSYRTGHDVSITDDDLYRVATFEDGEAFVQDPRSDYMVTADGSSVELTQNEEVPGFQVHDAAEDASDIDVHFLQDNEYQVQQQVTVELYETTETADVWLNATVSEQPSDLGAADGTDQVHPDNLFDAPRDLTYEQIAEDFEDDRAVPTDYTNDNGDFELFNLPTSFDGQEYFVVAGAGDEYTADGDDRMGFANFAGYDVVEVSPNADSQNEQYNTDLTVQQYEPVIDFQYQLDVTVVDDDGENVKHASIPQDEERNVEIQVESRQAGTDDDYTAVGDGVDVSALILEDEDEDVGELLETDLETDATGVATTTFSAFSAGDGTVNVSAQAEDDLSLVETEGGEQAQITVFGAATITGDVVNEHGDNLPTATVSLYENAQALEDGEAASVVEAGELGSFTFVENQQTGERLQSDQTWLVEAEFEGETETRWYGADDGLNTGTNDGDIVIVGVEPTEATFNIDDVQTDWDGDVEAGQQLSVDVTVENIGDEFGSDYVSIVLDGEVQDTVEIGDEKPTGTLSFVAPDDEGDYTWSLETSDDSTDELTLTVAADEDETSLERFDLENTGDITFDDVLAAIGAHNDNETIGGDEVEFDDVLDVISAHNDDVQV